MAASLTIPIAGSGQGGGADDTLTIPLDVRRASLVSNDHNHADTLDLTVDWKDAGVDPRLLANATVLFYLGNAPDGRRWQPTQKDLRFVGMMRRPRRVGDGNEGLVVELLFGDYTTLFLECRRFPASGVPDLTDDLASAWRKICAATGPIDAETGELQSSVTALADRLVLIGLDSPPVLGRAVAPRFKKLGKVQVKPEADAWAVWQQCVGMCGLISFIELDQCIVTTATDYYTSSNPPRLVWGQNILRISEERDARTAGAGVGIASFDPVSGTSLEALWPPVGDASIKRRRLSAKKAGSPDAVRQSESREYFAYPGVTDDAVLLEIAKRVYEERSRQDFEATLTTSELSVDALDGSAFDLLRLAAGDVLRIEVDRADTEWLGELSSDEERINYLVGAGYSEGVAKLITLTLDTERRLTPNFYVKRVTTHFETSPEGGTFEVEVNVCNRIDIDGNAS